MTENNKILDDLTIVLVSFYSNEKIDELISKINFNIKIIIVENSLNTKYKKLIEDKHKNITVIIPNKNLGNGGGINEGLKNAKTKYVLSLDPDVIISESTILKLVAEANRVQNFAILAPKISGQDYSEYIIKYNDQVKLNQISFSTGCAILLNKSVISFVGMFDENFFLYFEELDLYTRCINLNKPIYLLDNISVEHIGTSSINLGLELKSKICRNWHYCWSKFYYYKKHFNYIYALKKTFPNLRRSIAQYIINKIKRNNEKALIHKAELQGLIAAYFLQKPYYRISI